jgi:hypothetical protein
MHAVPLPHAAAGLALVASSVIAVTPVASPPDLHHVTSAAVRLADASTDLLGGVTSIDPLAGLGSLANDLGSIANVDNLANLAGGLANTPYNVFADIVNIPYYESLALDEYAFALGPAGSVGGVPGWIPPGTASTGIDIINGLPYYAIGGTGSWYMESIGNTWGWDDGNWPQVDALLHAFLPFSFTESLADQIQTLAQGEFIDGSGINCEFECANVLGYFGGWGDTPLTKLLSGYTFPAVLADTIGQNSLTGIINVGPNPPGSDLVIWAGQQATLNPLAPLAALAANLTGSPANNPIMFPNPADLVENVIKLSNEINYLDFNPFVEGSFLYWGAPTLWSVPAGLGGIAQSLTGIPNQFANVDIGWPLHGAEPLSGYTAGLPQLVEGLPQGFEYLLRGLLGYVTTTLPPGLNGPLDALGNLGTGPAELLESTGIANLWTGLTTTVPSSLAGLNTETGSIVSSLLPGAGLGPTWQPLVSMPGPDVATDLASTLSPNLPDLASTLSPDLPDLASTLSPDLPTDLDSLIP